MFLNGFCQHCYSFHNTITDRILKRVSLIGEHNIYNMSWLTKNEITATSGMHKQDANT